jgi:nicotinamidase-related amidase
MSGKSITILDDEQWPANGFAFTLPIKPETTALGIIDVQHYCTDPESDLARTVQNHDTELFENYSRRVEEMLVNIVRLLDCFRHAGRRVFYTRHGAQLPDGADMILRRRGREERSHNATEDESGHMPGKGSAGFEILEAIAPVNEDLVLDKNTSSAFHSTPIDLYLRNMGIETIVLTGLAADMCVNATALDAADRGFHVIVVSDATATFDPGSAEAVQILFGRIYGYVMKTEDILEWMATGVVPSQTSLPVSSD